MICAAYADLALEFFYGVGLQMFSEPFLKDLVVWPMYLMTSMLVIDTFLWPEDGMLEAPKQLYLHKANFDYLTDNR
jgi:hypothetical protein